MATSGYKSVTVTSWDTLKFSWWEDSQSIPNNTTTIGWKLELIAGSSGKISSTTSKAWSVTVDGTKYSGTNNVGISNNATKTLASGTTTIAHNSNGTKTFSYSFSQEFSITFSGANIGTKSGSGSGTLDTIPRASSLSVSNGTLGTAQTLTVTKHDGSFTHTITYKCGSASGTIATKSSNTSLSWTPPLTLAQQNTTGTTVSVVFTITTYSGDTSIGTATKSIVCSIPASVKPSVSLAVSDPMGYSNTFGAYVQGLSKIKVDVTASGNQGSTIKSYKTTADGMTYTVADFTTAAISNTGTLEINVTVTDSRGRTASASTTISVLAYSVPKITTLNVKRSDSQGNSSSSGSYLAITFDATITALNNANTATYKVQYKKASESTYTTVSLSNLNGKLSVSNGLCVIPADTGSTYNIILTASDTFTSASKTATGSSVKKLWSVLSKGLGFAFGKVAEFEGVLDVGFKTKFTGGIQNEVLEKISDLNDVKTPNTYVSINKGASSYTNCPIASGTFVLEVMSAGAEGQVFQRLTSTFKDGLQECYERHFFSGSWGSWSCVYQDTGWVDLTLQSGISVGTECGFLRGRRKGGVLYIKGDVVGIAANWKYFAHVPASLLSSSMPTSTRFVGLYNMSYICGLNLTNGGQLYVSTNGAGTWDTTKNTTINIAICL